MTFHRFVKFFPASCYGGLKTMEALFAAPFSQIRFMPTGGVNAANLQGAPVCNAKKLLPAGEKAGCVKEGLLKEKRFDEAERLSKRSSSACGKRMRVTGSEPAFSEKCRYFTKGCLAEQSQDRIA